MSKVFEKMIFIQIESFIEDKLSKLLTGFRKNQSTQHYLISRLEKWKNVLDEGDFVYGLSQNTPQFINCQNRSTWFSQTFFHEKVLMKMQ